MRRVADSFRVRAEGSLTRGCEGSERVPENSFSGSVTKEGVGLGKKEPAQRKKGLPHTEATCKVQRAC